MIQSLIRPLDRFLNGITMYRLLLYGLSLLALVSLIFAYGGRLPISGNAMALSAVVLAASTYLSNRLLAWGWQVPANNESWAISGLILFFILPQATSPAKSLMLALAGILAMASKYLIVWRRSHFLNPAATAAVILGLAGLTHASWWVGNGSLWPFVLLFGLLVVRKIRRMALFLTFLSAALAAYLATGLRAGNSPYDVLQFAVTTSPLLFLGTIMLTEPATMPSRRREQVLFAALVALLFGLHPSVAGFFVYPETALLIGNLYALAVSPRFRVRLRLSEVQQLAPTISNYVFTPDQPIRFKPGQYLEWTLPGIPENGRGNRRTFSLASSPTEASLMLGVKFYQPSSSFKQRLRGLEPGATLLAGQLAGDFTLPDDTGLKLAFIAGGIGITPFRSMLKYLVDTNQRRDIIVLYFVSDPAEAVYSDVLTAAAAIGVRTTIIASQADKPVPAGLAASLSIVSGRIDNELIGRHIPDLTDRRFYVSGPNALVEATVSVLKTAGVSRSRVRTDHFSGY